MGMIRVMNARGDDSVSWDPQQAALGDRAAQAAVEEAERIVREHLAKGGAAFRVDVHDPQRRSARIDGFDVTAEQIILVPRYVGG